jgi:hypothetical protein
MASNRSPHILNTSSNLLGFCLIVLTSIKISNSGDATVIDDITGIAAVLLVISCVLSFLSIKTSKDVRARKLENIADIVFLSALIGVAVVIVLVSCNLLT